MSKARRARAHGARALALAALAGAAAGCMQFDDLEGDIKLTTHVGDWRDQVIYQVMVDRFADGDWGNNYLVNRHAAARYHGGDWAGLESLLGYLAGLGVTALWISPVYRNVETDADVDGYHGYWPQDLTAPNPHFGDVGTLRRLVRSAHERDMLVIFDVVTNHVGQLFFYDINLNGHADEQVRGSGTRSDVVHINEYDPDFDPRGIQAYTSLGEAGPAPIIFVNDPLGNHMPPLPEVLQRAEMYNRRGRTLDFEDPDQLLHGDFPGGLKDLDTTRCEVKQAMVDVYARWIELTDADGFRIDTVKHVEREFWRFFTQKIRQKLAAKGKGKVLFFGESFDGRDALVGTFTKNEPPSKDQLERESQCVTDRMELNGDQLDSMFYFPQYYTAIRDVFQLGLSTDRIQDLWAMRPQHYGTAPNQLGIGVAPADVPVGFLDNHDVPRFLYSGAGVPALHLALLFLMTEQGIPCIYYGTEQELAGGNDPANREDLWLTGYDTATATYGWIKRLAAMRKAYVALRRGGTNVVWASSHAGTEPDAGIFAFERSGGDAGAAYALVVLNASREHASAPAILGSPMKISAPAGTVLVDVLPPGRPSYTVAPDGTLSITVGPLSGALLVPQSDVVKGL
ncbi:MAG: alpha-amylase [Deltaproteobacteria bacterium]|nr:alpha-amylase [Deltaproteobacteria bacterium]